MTTTNVSSIIHTSDGMLYHGEGEPTDAAAASEHNIRDIAGTSQSVKDALRGKTITRIEIQASDGSILTSFGIMKNSQYIYFTYGGERVASSPSTTNLDIWDLNILVDETTKLMIVTDE